MKQVTTVITKGLIRLSLLFFSFSVFAQDSGGENSSVNLRRGATDISGQVYDLHMLMFFICVGIAWNDRDFSNDLFALLSPEKVDE